MFVRYEGMDADPVLGFEVGIFGLVNRMGRRGQLTPEQESYRRNKNAWLDGAYPDPSTVDPSVYDRSLNPRAKAWFKEGVAGHLLVEVEGYLAILRDHDVPYRRSVSRHLPGRLIYEDDVQVVVVPL